MVGLITEKNRRRLSALVSDGGSTVTNFPRHQPATTEEQIPTGRLHVHG